MQNLKLKIYNLIRDDDKNNIWGNIFDGTIIFLITLNVIIVILETFQLSYSILAIFQIIEIITVVVFTIEYLVRLWTSNIKFSEVSNLKSKVKLIFSFMAIIDLFAILPFYLQLIVPIDIRLVRVFRLFRLFRLFKLNRYTNSLTTIFKVIKNKSSQLISSVFLVSFLMIIASVIMYEFENAAQPELFQNAFSGFWWAINTITTVGYGDIYPITTLGKLLSVFISVLGIGLVAVPTGIISAGFIEFDEANDKKSNYYIELLQINKLYEKQIITEEEFKQLKQKVIERE
ncbi:MAG: ion transporter [Firmicutes bacterium]|nr:ion transporter [Bacillota bacterium]